MSADHGPKGPVKTGNEESDNWAKIWFVAPQMEGSRSATPEQQKVISEIASLRTQGKLTKPQCEMLDQIGLNAAGDFDF